MTILELAEQRGLKPKWAASTQGGEYHSPCPACGGDDRFYIQPNKKMSKCVGSYRCRQCGIHGDAIEFARQFHNLSFQEAAEAVNATMTQESWTPISRRLSTPQKMKLIKPPEKWITTATDFTLEAHKKLLTNQNILKFLEARGIPLAAVERYKLGWIDKNRSLQRGSWGLAEETTNMGLPQHLWMPRGLLIPTIEIDQVMRLKVRRFDWRVDDKMPKYAGITGSMKGLTLVGDVNQRVMIVVESELDAYAIDHAAHDFAFAVAVGGCVKNIDNVTDMYAKRATSLLICHDNDEAGKKMLLKWQSHYPHAISYPTPLGKDIGEAIEGGLNICEWLLKACND